MTWWIVMCQIEANLIYEDFNFYKESLYTFRKNMVFFQYIWKIRHKLIYLHQIPVKKEWHFQYYWKMFFFWKIGLVLHIVKAKIRNSDGVALWYIRSHRKVFFSNCALLWLKISFIHIFSEAASIFHKGSFWKCSFRINQNITHNFREWSYVKDLDTWKCEKLWLTSNTLFFCLKYIKKYF